MYDRRSHLSPDKKMFTLYKQIQHRQARSKLCTKAFSRHVDLPNFQKQYSESSETEHRSQFITRKMGLCTMRPHIQDGWGWGGGGNSCMVRYNASRVIVTWRLLVNRQTHTTENITFTQIRWWAVMIVIRTILSTAKELFLEIKWKSK